MRQHCSPILSCIAAARLTDHKLLQKESGRLDLHKTLIYTSLLREQAWKPPRAHHDSISNHCVLKMDHYCVWVANCVGLLNYKAFLLFLLYSFMATGMGTLVLLGAFIGFLKHSSDDDAL